MSRIESGQTGKRVSVLIPLYNHAQYIEECLDSVLAQGLDNLELLLLDDGSSDDGFAVASRWKERHQERFARIVFEQQSNAGITQTFDRLIRKSSGDFIAILASDDVLLPNSISDRLALLAEEGVLAVFGDALPVDDRGQAIGTSAIGELGNPSAREALRDQRTVHWELIFRWNVYGSVLLCRREAMVTPDGLSVLNLGFYSEDMQLYYRFSSLGALRYLDRPVAKYRVHASSASHAPGNVAKLRKNVYQTRRHSLAGMPWRRRIVVALQSFTYHRWNNSWSSRLALPLVAFSYAGILMARIFYDFYRTSILRQSRKL